MNLKTNPTKLSFAFVLLSFGALAQDVPTANYDNNRTNATLAEGVLTTSNVNHTQFGKLFAFPVDGQVYAQPLFVHALAIQGKGTLDVLFVATMHNSVYAFDATAATGLAALWQVNLGVSVEPMDLNDTDPNAGPAGIYADIQHEVGILGTPVIDRSTNTLYAVAFTKLNGALSYHLHALDLATGTEKFNGPIEIAATVPGNGWDAVNGQVAFNAAMHLQRPGLLLLNGAVYVGFGSHGDFAPWHGWLFGYNASNLLQQTALFNATPQQAAGSLWQGGHGLAADSQDIFFSTGNGNYDGQQAWSQSVLRLTTNGSSSVVDWFTPSEWDTLNVSDVDLGSNGPILMPGTNLLCAVGKEGQLFLLDRSNMGREVMSNTQILQNFPVTDSSVTIAENLEGFFVFNTAYWDQPGASTLYVWPFNESLRSFKFTDGRFDTTPSAINTTAQNALPFSGFSVSSNGTVPGTGILWATSVTTGNLPAPGTLHAFDAANIVTELWNSDGVPARDLLGNFTKFANPTVARGRVYVPTDSQQVVVYGLLPNVPGIATVVNAASFQGGAVSPGELITLFGDSIGPLAPSSASPNMSALFPTTLAGLTLTFDGQPAPLLFGSSGQINAVVPYAVGGTTQLKLTTPAGAAFTMSLPVFSVVPAIFTQNSSGAGQGAILNSPAFSMNSPANPASRGSTVSLYLTGAGPLTSPLNDGALAPAINPPQVQLPITVTIGGEAAPVSYQGAAPGLVAGLIQVNVRIPTGITPGPTVPLTLTVGDTPAQNTVTIAVK